MRRLTALAVLAAVLAACGSGSEETQHGTSFRVDGDPFRITVLHDGEPVAVQDAGARLRYQLAESGEQRKLTKVLSESEGPSGAKVYEVATEEPERTALVTVGEGAGAVHVSVELRPAAGVQQLYDAFETAADDHFLGSGARGDQVDLRGQILQIKVAEPCAYVAVPFFASSAGWGVRLPTHRVSAFAFPGSEGGSGCRLGDHPACGFPPLEDRVEVCVTGARLDEELYAGTFSEVLDAYEAAAGQPRVPPPSQLELIKWRDVNDGPDEVLEDVRRLQTAGIPLGWMLVDNPWETCNGTLTFDRERFPDPAGLIRRVHERGVRFMLWVSPKVTCGGGYPPGAELGEIENRTLDLRRPAVVAEFQRRLGRLRALGVDGVKGDRGDEVDLEAISPTLQNRYPVLFAESVLDVWPRDAGAIFRAAAMGSQPVIPGLWAGDQPGEWIGLQRAIRFAQSSAMSGFPTWGSDVGGYSAGNLTADVFMRWTQLGAISPVMEVGGAGPNATPWVLGPLAMRVLREAAVLHYELFPYLYGLLERREPVLRPLGYAYPDDPEAWRADLELLVGPDLLAAPVGGPGTSPTVYLPAGEWVDLYAGETVAGGRTFTRETPMTEFPLYARAGAVIPFNLRTQDDPWWGLNEQSHRGRAGFLATDGAELDLHDQPAGVQIFVPASSRPRAVTIGGDDVDWSWHGGPMPGAVIRLEGPDVEGMVSVEP
jgi:alpha-D-xyloside xylohydrolase